MIGELTIALITSCAPSDVKSDLNSLLSEKTSYNLPGVGKGEGWEKLIDRVQLATIKGSNWKLSSVRKYSNLANIDWRDLLMAKGFAEDLDAHIQWQKTAIKNCDIENDFAIVSEEEVNTQVTQLICENDKKKAVNLLQTDLALSKDAAQESVNKLALAVVCEEPTPQLSEAYKLRVVELLRKGDLLNATIAVRSETRLGLAKSKALAEKIAEEYKIVIK